MYVFCGASDKYTLLNSIERIRPENDANWELLQVSKKIPVRADCGAVAIDDCEDRICIFGGSHQVTL